MSVVAATSDEGGRDCAWSTRSHSMTEADCSSPKTKYYERIGERQTSCTDSILALLSQLRIENMQQQSHNNNRQSAADETECIASSEVDVEVDFLQASVFDSPPFSSSTPSTSPASLRSLSPIPQVCTPKSGVRFYRSKSLRSALRTRHSEQDLCSAPNTQKKMVRFADALGLDLEQIRNIAVHDNAFSKFVQPDDETEHYDEPLGFSAKRSVGVSGHGKYLLQRFSLPPARNTDRLLDKRQVILESCTVADTTLTGVIKVTNIAFEKTVAVRYTLDEWRTYHEVSAAYIPRSSDGFVDKFVFSLFLPHDIPQGCVCHFAIKYNVLRECYWDNNGEENYAVEMSAHQPAAPTHFHFPSSYLDYF